MCVYSNKSELKKIAKEEGKRLCGCCFEIHQKARFSGSSATCIPCDRAIKRVLRVDDITNEEAKIFVRDTKIVAPYAVIVSPIMHRGEDAGFAESYWAVRKASETMDHSSIEASRQSMKDQLLGGSY